MKRIFCVVMSLALLFSISATFYVSFAEDSENGSKAIAFEPFFTNISDRQTEEWMKDDDMRIMATVSLVIDLITARDEDGITIECLGKTTFIGQKGPDLVVYVHGDVKDFLVFYRAATDEAVYMEMTASSNDDGLEIALAKECVDGLYRNDVEAVKTYWEALLQDFESLQQELQG